MAELPKAYNPSDHEKAIYKEWLDSGYFNPDKLPNARKRKPFTISLPPPNATGILHIGHGLVLTLQDIMTRYHRMAGRKALWLPGTDHAAIATQYVVEKELKKEGKRRQDLGREKFLERVNAFVEDHRGTITEQTKRMGASCDWSRERFTMDEGLSKAVQTAFVKMYEDGLIYRGTRVVNWCPHCQSTLADDEVEYKEEPSTLYTFRYDKDFPIAISTTRPETKFGDTAVAVHPSDKRYAKYVGNTFTVHLAGVERQIRIVAHHGVEQEFGTGALGVTPAHSAVDEAIAQKEKLLSVVVIDKNGRMTTQAGEYAGLKVKEAREKLVAWLRANHLLEKEEAITHNLSICYRCGTAIEPMPLEQWFVAVDKPTKKLGDKSLKQRALEASTKNEIQFIPDRFTNAYRQWMENLHDWCISRQIWYGHRIPVWYCDCGETIVSTGVPKKCPSCKVNYVFLHGFYRTKAVKDPLGWLNKELVSKDNFFSVLPHANRPDPIEQMQYVKKNAVINEHTVVVAHSLGSLLAIKLIAENNLHIQKLILVAPPLRPYREEIGAYNNEEWNFSKLRSQVKEIVVFWGEGDHIVPKEESEKIAKELGAKFVVLKNVASHFNQEQVPEILAESKTLHQDPDTLDTWFSSSLWTFSTLGWPKKTKDLKTFHPTDVMETAYEIITLWVSRMIMMSEYFMGEIPFRTVYLHGLVRDKQGRKMSKSLGNGIDPLEMADKYGADAVRLSLVIGTTPGNDQKLYEEKIASFRNYANKLWNIGRFLQMQLDSSPRVAAGSPATATHSKEGGIPLRGDPTRSEAIAINTLSDRWIASRLERLVDQTTNQLENFSFGQAGESLYDFAWHEFADWYLEVAKFEKNVALANRVFRTALILLHPFMPFVTEMLWKELGYGKDLLMVETWPKAEKKMIDEKAEAEFAALQEATTTLRKQKKEMADHGESVESLIVSKDSAAWRHKDLAEHLLRVSLRNR